MKHIYLFQQSAADKFGYNLLADGRKYTNYISNTMIDEYHEGAVIVAVSDVELPYTIGERVADRYKMAV